MDIRIIIYALIFIFGFAFSTHNSNKKSREYLIKLYSIIFILESCLRGTSVGPDTFGYFLEFESVKNATWNSVLEAFPKAYIYGEGKDPGFHVLIYLLQSIYVEWQFFLFIIACLFFIPFGMIIYRNTTKGIQIVFAYTLYLALFNIVALSGIRQQIATSLCFISVLLLQKNKEKSALLIILAASTIHISAVLFLSLIFFNRLKPKLLKTTHLIAILLIPVVLAFSQYIVAFLGGMMTFDYYTVYGERTPEMVTPVFVILVDGISILCYFFLDKIFISQSGNKLFYAMLPMLTILVPLIVLDGAMIRMSQYFTLFLPLIIQSTIEYKFGNTSINRTTYLVAIGVLTMLALNSSFNYTFFWAAQPNY